jgi:hypothetical protein
MPDNGVRPRAVRSRLVATKSCSPALNEYQLAGSIMAGNPPMRRALEMAARVAPEQPAELSYPPEAQLARKLGTGAILATGSPTMRVGPARGAGGGVVTVGASTPAGRVRGGVVVGETGMVGAGAGTVVDGGDSVVDECADCTMRRCLRAFCSGILMVAWTIMYVTTAVITIGTIASKGAMRERLVSAIPRPEGVADAVDREKRGARVRLLGAGRRWSLS